MKKLLIALCMASALTLAARAEDAPAKKDGPKKAPMTAEQKALNDEMKAKYDENKDGKLSKEEKARFSAEDKARWDAAFPKKKADAAPKADAPAEKQ